MAFRYEKNRETGYPEIVIDGFENGIADSPYEGIGDIRNANTTSISGEASVNFDTEAMLIPPAVNSVAFTALASTDVFTWTPGGALQNGFAIQLNSTTAGGTSTGVVYYVGSISGSTFKIYTTINRAVTGSTPVNVTSDGSGTFSTYQLAAPTHSCLDYAYTSTTGASYMVDSKEQVWLLIPFGTSSLNSEVPGTIIFLGNIGSTNTGFVNSISVWKGYLFLFKTTQTDYWKISLGTAPASNWVYNWAAYSPSGTTSVRSLVSQDDSIYICANNGVDSIQQNAGKVFDPTDVTTYTVNVQALELPTDETAICLCELGIYLLVGGTKNFIYPWDRISTSYNYPLVVPERYVYCMVSTNSNSYVFAGNKGRIYITNGSNIDLYKKIPDYVSGTVEPYYLTGGKEFVTSGTGQSPDGEAIYWRNNIYFSFRGLSNSGTSLTTVTGLWAIDLGSGALRLLNRMSYGTYAGRVGTIVPNISSLTQAGNGVFCGWNDGNGNPGIDASTSNPYSNFETYIDTDIVNVGSFLNPNTPAQIEWKTSVPLGGNGTSETIRISYRTNLLNSFTLVGTTTISTVATSAQANVSDVYNINFEKVQWVQLRIETASNSTTPTYCRLTEIRIRNQQ